MFIICEWKNLKTTLDPNPLAFVKGAAELFVTQPFNSSWRIPAQIWAGVTICMLSLQVAALLQVAVKISVPK